VRGSLIYQRNSGEWTFFIGTRGWRGLVGLNLEELIRVRSDKRNRLKKGGADQLVILERRRELGKG
jgi:hypothetical protein